MLTRVELRIAVGAGCWQAELSLPLRQPFGYAQDVAQGNRKLLEGKLPGGTPERLTLTAAVEGLRALTRPCDVRLRACPPGGYSNDDFDCWDALIALTKTHQVEWDAPFDAPDVICGWCRSRADWWRRPDEWGGGRVCGRCHPDPHKEHNIKIWSASR